jgi:DNA-binding LacI/PurR family transcriptional regulator
MRDHRSVVAPPMPRGHWSPESGYRAGLELAGIEGVSAVFAANDHGTRAPKVASKAVSVV